MGPESQSRSSELEGERRTAPGSPPESGALSASAPCATSAFLKIGRTEWGWGR